MDGMPKGAAGMAHNGAADPAVGFYQKLPSCCMRHNVRLLCRPSTEVNGLSKGVVGMAQSAAADPAQ